MGGWRPARDATGNIDKGLSPCFFVRLDDKVAPWACEKDRQPFRVVASLEALAALAVVLTLGPPDGTARTRGSVLPPPAHGQPGDLLRALAFDDDQVPALSPRHGAGGHLGG